MATVLEVDGDEGARQIVTVDANPAPLTSEWLTVPRRSADGGAPGSGHVHEQLLDMCWANRKRIKVKANSVMVGEVAKMVPQVFQGRTAARAG